MESKEAADSKKDVGRQASLKLSSAPPATIPEEGQPPNVEQAAKHSEKAPAGRSNNNRYNNRRRSADLSNLSSYQQQQKPKPRFNFNPDQSRQKSFDNLVQSGDKQHQSGQGVTKDRRRDYNKQRSNSHRNFSSAELQSAGSGGSRGGSKGNKSRSMSTQNADKNEGEPGDGGGRRKQLGSTTSNGKSTRIGSSSINSNGESFEYDEMELEEPFSDSDDETFQKDQKPCLVIPRGRIRTLSGTVPPIGFSPRWGGPTMCLSCLQFFNLPDEIGKFADHLLDEHRIVILDFNLIVDPKRYVEYWRQRFAKTSVDNIFSKVTPSENDPYFGKVDYYYEMSERITEDYSLRQRLAMRRLEEALQCQQREREEVTFSMQCIFCRYVARGNRSKMIHHLYMIHHLNLGSPDNLVFVAEYVEHLKEKLQRNECIYCEKTFSDRSVLMDHMRKRNHREVNPKNNYYDRFYIINYLELGKRWLDVLAEDFEDTMPTFADSDDEEEEEGWHEWQEDTADDDQIRAICLFCEKTSEKIEVLLDHMKEQHSFNLIEFVQKEDLDLYGRMKFLNYLRKQTYNTPNYRTRSRNSGCSRSSGGLSSPTANEKKGDEAQSVQEKKKEDSETDADTSLVTLPNRELWDIEENLVPLFGNDHLPWMLEGYIEEKNSPIAEKEQSPGLIRKSKSTMSESADTIDPQIMELAVKAYIDESKVNTVETVIVEDWPDMEQSVLKDPDVVASLR